MTPKLSPRTRQLIDVIFHAKHHDEVAHWLEDECGNNMPFCEEYDDYQMERIRFAVLKLNQGNITKLLKAIDETCLDWRDLFMAADFGYDKEAHEKWVEMALKRP